MTKKERLNRIAEIIGNVDDRCAAVDGPVSSTMEMITQEEMSEIYILASANPIEEREGIKQTITVDDCLDFLNDLLKIDPNAISTLCSIRVNCNEAMANHPTVQVGALDKSSYYIFGIIGLLNGLFGADKDGWGTIGTIYADKDWFTVKGFGAVKKPEEKND